MHSVTSSVYSFPQYVHFFICDCFTLDEFFVENKTGNRMLPVSGFLEKETGWKPVQRRIQSQRAIAAADNQLTELIALPKCPVEIV